MATYLEVALAAARAAGTLLRDNFGKTPHVNEFAAHDIKLELDVKAQDLITGMILQEFPDHAILGEEGLAGDAKSEFQWVLDPLDGTVNYFYGIPHFCISIAMRHREETQVGVIYDPMRDEMFTAVKTPGSALLNDRAIKVSERAHLGEAMVSVGLAKVAASINSGLPKLQDLVHRVRKTRMMGSAALDLAYVACGRLDAYIESGVSLWDIAAGVLLVQNAGGVVEQTPRGDQSGKIAVVAASGLISELSAQGVANLS